MLLDLKPREVTEFPSSSRGLTSGVQRGNATVTAGHHPWQPPATLVVRGDTGVMPVLLRRWVGRGRTSGLTFRNLNNLNGVVARLLGDDAVFLSSC